MELPTCPRCKKNPLVPLSDYGQEGSSVEYKAWVCLSDTCRFEIRVDKGKVSYTFVEKSNGAPR